jgi:hypothetical protein
MSELVAVRLLRHYGNINAGEVAGYAPALAEQLVVELKVAEYFKPANTDSNDGDDDHKDELTLAKFSRLNVEQLKALAAEKNIDLGDATSKADIQAKVKAVLFPADGE